MEVTCRDMGHFVGSNVVTIDNDALAAGTGDATEVTGANIDVSGYDSGKLLISYVTSLTADKTLSFAVDKREGASDALCTADTDVALLAATVVKTGAATGYEGVLELDIDFSGKKQYLGLDITPDLSHSGTDTCTWSAVLIGLKKSV